NFLSSLDGRIALFDQSEDQYVLPDNLKCDEDFLLFLELYAQADCIITHGGYMRSLASGRLGNVLELPQLESTRYLHEWRENQGMAASPDVVILSGSLDFPWNDTLDQSGRNVHIATGGAAQNDRMRYWQQAGKQVRRFGQCEHVDVNLLMEFLGQQGYRSVYLVAGPQLLNDLIVHDWVDRIYLTISQQFLGGESFKTLLSGSVLGQHGCLQLQRLYMDPQGSNGVSQLYSEYTFKVN
ncbi:MAG: dihydrofolate reductase family protein, partial [Pseudomonadota bacterium]